MKRLSLVAALVLLLLLAAVIERINRGPAPLAITPTLTGQVEYCLTCHNDLPEISAAHPLETFGCVLCHGGERLALDDDLAHSSLRGGANPSDPATVTASCGGTLCHNGEVLSNRDHIQRVQASLHSTYAGAIAAVRFQAGLQPDRSARQAIQAVVDLAAERPPLAVSMDLPKTLEALTPEQAGSSYLTAFAANCLGCHLSSQPAPGDEWKTGCAACHSPSGGDPTQPAHRLKTAIPSAQCLRCHGRGSYDLGQMQFSPHDQPGDNPHPNHNGYAKCTVSLDCIDCHTRLEVMGDGHLLNSSRDLTAISCASCHGTRSTRPATQQITSPEDIALRLAFLNPSIDLDHGERIVLSEHGEPLWNVRQQADHSFSLARKISGQLVPLPLVSGSLCTQDTAQQRAQDCSVCHRAPGVIAP